MVMNMVQTENRLDKTQNVLSRSKLTVSTQEREVGSHWALFKKTDISNQSRVVYTKRKIGSCCSYCGSDAISVGILGSDSVQPYHTHTKKQK